MADTAEVPVGPVPRADASLVSITAALVRASVRTFAKGFRGNALRAAGSSVLIISEAVGVWLLVDRAGGIGGWSTGEVLVLLGIADIGLGLGMLVCEPLEPPTFSQQLRDGRFDSALTQPLPPWLWLVATDVQIRNTGRMLGGLGVFAYGAALADVDVSLSSVGAFLLASVAMGVTVGAVLTIGAAITMWTIEGTELLNAFTYGGASLAGWPLQIYAGALRAVFLWIVPVGLSVYVPALWILDRSGPAGLGRGLLPLVPVFVGLVVVGAALAWRAGLRRYLETGG